MVVCLSKVLKGPLFQQHMVVVVAAAAAGGGIGIVIVIVVITSIIVIVITSSSSSTTTTPSRPVYKASKPKLKYQEEGSMPSLPRHAYSCKPIAATHTTQ